jgi:hypothetical protein
MNLEPSKFKASHSKVKRAEHHFIELRNEVQRYVASSPLSLVWETMPWSGRFADIYPPDAPILGLIPRVKQPVPGHFAPIIGDIVHNLRSAMDIMMCELVLVVDGSVKDHQINFPYWKSETDKEGAIRKSNALRAGPRLRKLIEAWEPFSGGASRLFALSQLDNRDKHRALIPTLNGAEYSQGFAMFAHEISANEFIDPFPTRKRAIDGEPFMVSTLDVGPPIGTEVPCVCHLGLDGVDDIKGHGLVEEMQWQIEVVSGALLSFEFDILPEFLPPEPRKPVHTGDGVWMCPPEMQPDEVDKFFRHLSGRSIPTF